MTKDFEISYTDELLRKSIHLSSLSIPIVYSFFSTEFTLWVLVPMTILSIILDFASRKKSKLRDFYIKMFGKILRPHEYHDVFTLNGASWVLITAVMCVVVFPKLLMITGFSILIISDISSALIGRRYGKHKLFVGKSWEGTMAFWISAIVVVVIIGILFQAPWTYFVFGFIAAIIGGFAEAASTMLKMDDNFTIPLSVGFAMWIGAYFASYYLLTPYIPDTYLVYPYLNIFV